MVEAFSRKARGAKLVVLGKFDEGNAYHAAVRAAASDEVLFPGAIYDKAPCRRCVSMRAPIATATPSAAPIRRWSSRCGAATPCWRTATASTRGPRAPEQFFFSDTDECERMIERILTDDIAVARAGRMARLRAAADFIWTDILSAYERELAALGGYRLEPPKPEPAESLPSGAAGLTMRALTRRASSRGCGALAMPAFVARAAARRFG